MIEGYFNESGYPCIDLIVFGNRGNYPIEAIIDTGFDGDLCLPIQIAIQIGLELVSVQRFELA
ncbi:MAG: hypothetical protein ACE5J9_02125, partial [Methanosarcinales archaeon]